MRRAGGVERARTGGAAGERPRPWLATEFWEAVDADLAAVDASDFRLFLRGGNLELERERALWLRLRRALDLA
jgi:hypothetical protein